MKMDDMKLIALVKRHDELYKKHTAGYKIPAVKEKAWNDISDELGEPVHVCAKRWRTLRERFARELKRDEDIAEQHVVEWPYKDAMMFLKGDIRARKRRCANTSDMLIEYDQLENQLTETFLNATTEEDSIPPPPKRNCTDDPLGKNFCKTEESSDTDRPPEKQSNPPTHNEEVSSFMIFLSAKMKNLTKDLQNRAMQDLLFYLIKMENFQDGASSEVPKIM